MALSRPKERIHPKALKVWRINGVIKSVIEWLLVIGFFLMRYFLFENIPFFIGIILIVLAAVMTLMQIIVIPQIRMFYWGYQINEHDIDIQHGIIVIKRTLVPMTRIQHVDTEHGPILRLFSLATLSISTAGTKHKIPALLQDKAEELRQQISLLAKVSEDDV